MKYYAERKGLLENDLNLSFDQLKEAFYDVYKYFEDRQCFDAATEGVWESNYGNKYQVMPPLLAPSPEMFFMHHLHTTNIYPIHKYYEYYSETDLFTIIEILYDKIGIYNYRKKIFETDELKKEFAIQINNILQFYEKGYFLETTSGIITIGTNDSLKMMLSEDLENILQKDIMSNMRSAIKLYYRFDSDLETKKKAITILADILEPIRSDLEEVLNEKFLVNKNDHDKLIFDIVNRFNIRHNNKSQLTQYEHEIWYDWMMQYYCSVIITYYKLIKIKS